MVKRHEEWTKKREEKISKKREIKKFEEIKDCTFEPVLANKKCSEISPKKPNKYDSYREKELQRKHPQIRKS